MIIIINKGGCRMEKVYFCEKSKYHSKKEYKYLKSMFPKIKIKRKKCLGKCKTCKNCPFTLVDGKVFKSDSTPELYLSIYKQILSN
ncbi:DUF1450 domain-containing protein [Bacillus sp. 31A1R]|uniref:DUF1450 domain-containing protein n=1 Tax=Robertmurraya mangrovi TaxID=3098077 RepID=A0ABU5IWL1_9BACI|nr:DUF1450 domain-containing protein [Bacillus sp. 31A1R]MDZ5471553.1 DUF1450 domain-containing protein [Bacillus sp. 31A1R]